MARTVAEHLVDSLAEAGVQRIYGIVGDSLNPVTDALRRRGTIQWVDVRPRRDCGVRGRGGGRNSPVVWPFAPEAAVPATCT